MEYYLIKSNGYIQIDASNLILFLQGKIYPNHTCISVEGSFSVSSLIKIQNLIRHRILEFTLQLEKSIPSANSITFSEDIKKDFSKQNKEKATQIFNQTFHGDNTKAIISSGENANINSQVTKGDKSSLLNYFISKGLKLLKTIKSCFSFLMTFNKNN